MKRVILIGLVLLQIYINYLFLLCRSFASYLHFEPSTASLHLTDLIFSDTDLPLLLIRFFHNKIVTFSLDVLNRYATFFDFSLFLHIVSPMGLWGMLFGYYYLFTKGSRLYKILGLALLILPMVEVLIPLSFPYGLGVYYVIIPFQLFSLFGYYHFLRHVDTKKGYITSGILFGLSLLWLVYYNDSITAWCIK